jgi:ribosomal protein S14
MVGRGLRSSPRKKDCILLDHSGNIVRFMADFERIFSEGLSELDLGEKLDNEIRKDKEKKEVAKCPRCGFSPFAMRCMACGHEKKVESEIEVSAGEMRQITLNGQVMAQDSQDLWNQICSYTKSVGRAETAKGRAWHLYRGIMGSVPRHLKFENSTEVYVSPVTHRKIKQINIAFAKRKTK